jgi:hypothetical protein
VADMDNINNNTNEKVILRIVSPFNWLNMGCIYFLLNTQSHVRFLIKFVRLSIKNYNS